MKQLLISLVFFISSCSSSTDTNTAQRDFNSKETKDMAKYMSEKLISQRLKAPATAEFTHDPNISFIGDGTFKIIGYVDSENSFGAKLRMNYTAEVKFINVIGDQEEWRLISFKEQ